MMLNFYPYDQDVIPLLLEIFHPFPGGRIQFFSLLFHGFLVHGEKQSPETIGHEFLVLGSIELIDIGF